MLTQVRKIKSNGVIYFSGLQKHLHIRGQRKLGISLLKVYLGHPEKEGSQLLKAIPDLPWAGSQLLLFLLTHFCQVKSELTSEIPIIFHGRFGHFLIVTGLGWYCSCPVLISRGTL